MKWNDRHLRSSIEELTEKTLKTREHCQKSVAQQAEEAAEATW